jgi:hypothetical protein
VELDLLVEFNKISGEKKYKIISIDNYSSGYKKNNISTYSYHHLGYESNLYKGMEIAFKKYNADYVYELHGDAQYDFQSVYFVDDSPAKQGFYTPTEHIPIISRKEANKKLPDYFIILAPNYSDVIIEKEAEFVKRGGKFIVPKNEIEIH